jgi:predicted transcriptional regulator
MQNTTDKAAQATTTRKSSEITLLLSPALQARARKIAKAHQMPLSCLYRTAIASTVRDIENGTLTIQGPSPVTTPKANFTVDLDRDLVAMAKAVAAKEGKTLSQLMQQALVEYL